MRSGYSLQFSDKLAMPSQKKQKKGLRHAGEAFSGRSAGWSASSAVGPLTYHRRGENAEGTGENTYRVPAFHACRKRVVLRPFDADRATRTGAPVTIRVGRFSPGSGGENGKDATDGRDRIDCRSWTFDREPDRGNALMIRFSVADPSCACSRTNISVRCPKPSKGV